MDEIDQRLRETSEACIKAYEAWNKDKKAGPAREALQESVHELRKVASRVEIEVAISERDEMTQKPIPIPPHRDSNKRGQDQEVKGDNRGNRAGANEITSLGGGNGGGGKSRGGRRGGSTQKKAGGEGKN